MATRQPDDVFINRLKELIPEGEARKCARRAGISEQTLSKWRTGTIKANPKLSTLRRLASVLRVPVAYLISDEATVVERPSSLSPEELRRGAQQIRELEELAKKLEGAAVRERKP